MERRADCISLSIILSALLLVTVILSSCAPGDIDDAVYLKQLYIDGAEVTIEGGITTLTGAQGEQGVQGLQGIQGDKGDKGDKGDQGIQGIQGTQGIQGEQGLKGDQGITGEQGIQGIQGEQGIQGDSGIIDISTWSLVRATKDNSTTQTIASASTWTKITFPTESYDINNEFATSTFTAEVSGYYLVNANIFYQTITGNTQIAIYVNGSIYTGLQQYVANHYHAFNISDIVYCPAGQTIEIYTWQDAGTNKVITNAANYNYISIVRVR